MKVIQIETFQVAPRPTSLGDHFTLPHTPERLPAVACASHRAGD